MYIYIHNAYTLYTLFQLFNRFDSRQGSGYDFRDWKSSWTWVRDERANKIFSSPHPPHVWYHWKAIKALFQKIYGFMGWGENCGRGDPKCTPPMTLFCSPRPQFSPHPIKPYIFWKLAPIPLIWYQTRGGGANQKFRPN